MTKRILQLTELKPGDACPECGEALTTTIETSDRLGIEYSFLVCPNHCVVYLISFKLRSKISVTTN